MNIEKNISQLETSENSKNELRKAILQFFENNGADTEVLKEYWEFLEESEELSGNKMYSDREKISNINNAKEYVQQLLENGVKPIISVPKEFLDDIEESNGIRAHETDIKSVKLIAGIIGDLPYKYDSNDRAYFLVDCLPSDLSPRLTGKQGVFNGVVVWNKNFIDLKNMKEIKKSSLFSQAA